MSCCHLRCSHPRDQRGERGDGGSAIGLVVSVAQQLCAWIRETERRSRQRCDVGRSSDRLSEPPHRSNVDTIVCYYVDNPSETMTAWAGAR